MSRTGTLLCLSAGVASGAMGVFGKLAFAEGATVGTLLAVRFVLAAVLFWALLGLRREAAALRALGAATIAAGLALGAVAYALQAGLYFAALDRLDASLLALLIYTFPAMVAAAAAALGRDRLDARKAIALILASSGLALVVAGAGAGAFEPLGAALGLSAAVVYATYILVSEGIARRVPARLLAALVCTGAAATLTAATAAAGDLEPAAVTAAGWGWLVALAAVSTVGAIALLFAGLARVGPTAASILATSEPLVTVALASAAFGETLTAGQLAGGALVLAAVPVLAGVTVLPRRARAAPSPARRRARTA